MGNRLCSFYQDDLRIVLVDKAKLLEWIAYQAIVFTPIQRKLKNWSQRKGSRSGWYHCRSGKTEQRLMQAFSGQYLSDGFKFPDASLAAGMDATCIFAGVLNMLLGLLCCRLLHTRSVIRQSYTLEDSIDNGHIFLILFFLII